MPLILRKKGYRFFFWSREWGEPPHVHVRKDENFAKFWLAPIELARSSGFRPHELTEIREIVVREANLFLERWNEHFSL